MPEKNPPQAHAADRPGPGDDVSDVRVPDTPGVRGGAKQGGGSSEVVLALDIGGTKLAAGLVDQAGRVHASVRQATPQGRHVDAETVWRALWATVNELPLDDVELLGVGVGCGGPMDWPSGVVSPLNIPAWRDFPLRERLEKEFPALPVRVHNDAVCVAVAEHLHGAGRGRRTMLGMVLSTGVGGGLILDDRLIDGASGNAGHIGHVIVDPDGPPCFCGGNGCLEAVASGPRLAEWARAQGWRPPQGRHVVTGAQLAADAARGHPVAVAAMERAGTALGRAVASATLLCDLELVVIGGGLSQAGHLLFAPMEEVFRHHVRLGFAREVMVVPVGLGQESGIIGAAALVLEGNRYWHAD